MLQFVSILDMLKTLCGHKWHSENFDDKKGKKEHEQGLNLIWTCVSFVNIEI